jgi:hypothetical protein
VAKIIHKMQKRSCACQRVIKMKLPKAGGLGNFSSKTSKDAQVAVVEVAALASAVVVGGAW